ncbi:MAG: AMP-binding protein, partial [Proteobacteria bacterium]|nr:AMP-binding protein [Pseudomonadota bacterium]
MSDIYTHIGEILARNARMYPDDVALIERIPAEKKRREVTWKQFDDKANQFSNVLAKKGVKKGDKIVHFMMNSIDWLAAYFGMVRTGAWVVPLNFRFTAEDVKYCCDVAEPTVIVFDEEFAGRIEAIKGQLPTVKSYICVGNPPSFAESFAKLVDAAPATPLNVEINSNDE